VTLLIGSSLYDPLSVELFDLILPLSLPAPEHPDAASYHPLPEIKHTFRPDHKVPPRLISAVSAALVVAPWVILLSLVSSFSFPLLYVYIIKTHDE
jgi:oligosaccharyltransferase complex subunit delta (ribophorin II)